MTQRTIDNMSAESTREIPSNLAITVVTIVNGKISVLDKGCYKWQNVDFQNRKNEQELSWGW